MRKRAMAGFLAMMMILSLVITDGTVLASEPRDGDSYASAEELMSHDYILYLANCGTNAANTVPAGYRKTGLYQSNFEQEYGTDEQTGKKWGYYQEAPNIAYGTSSAGGLTESKRYNYGSSSAIYTYVSGISGVYYNFELPAGEYEVTVGFYNNWDTRPVDIVLEGETVESRLSLTQNSNIVKNYSLTVTDGELNVKIHNPNRTSASADALVNYIIVKAPVIYDAEFLKAAVKEYTLTAGERELYSVSTLRKYDEAWYYADKVANDEEAAGFSEEKITSYYKKLVLKYNCLMEKTEPVTYSSFTGTKGEIWNDTNGTEIQGHGGQVQSFTYNGETKYYWYGEDKTDDKRSVDGGVRVYSSTDLYNWDDEGLAMRNLTDIYDFEEDYFNDLYGDATDEEKEEILAAINDSTSVIERPKVIYNELTDKYVMWFHADGPLPGGTSNYSTAKAGVAVSDSPAGPFKFLGRYRLNYVAGAYDSNKGMARDMNLFADDDGTGYIIYSSEENATLFISKLNEDYTYLSAEPEDAVEGIDFIRSACFVKQHREAPAPFKYNGKYYMLTSGTDGWAATQSRYAVADTMFGEWIDMGDPCVNDTSVTSYPANKTFGSQSTNVIPVDPANGKFIYMGDRWNKDTPLVNDYYEPKYVWLPVEFGSNGEMVLRPYADWTLEELENKGVISIESEFEDTIFVGEELNLPDHVTVLTGTEAKETNVTWNISGFDKDTPGVYTVTAILNDIISNARPRQIGVDIVVAVKNAVYIVNAGAAENAVHEGYERLVNAGARELKNQGVPDQEYDTASGAAWGYTGTGAVNQRESSSDLYESLLYVDGDLTYQFTDLRAGNYNVYVGYYDPWSQYAENRTVKVSINNTVVDNTRYITGTKEGVKYTASVGEDGVLQLDFVKTGDYDVLVSWIIVETELDIEEEKVMDDMEALKSLIHNWNINDEEEHQTFTVPTTTTNGSAVTWSSNNSAVSFKDGKANVKLQEKETVAALTVTVENGSAADSFTVQVRIPARKEEQIIPPVPAKPAVTRVTKGVKKNQLKLSVTKNHTAYYKLNNGKYKKYTKTVSFPVGKNVITVYTVDKNGVKSGTISYTIKVAKPKATKSIKLKVKKKKKIKLKNASVATKITYKSNKPQIAAVNKKGKVTGKKAGKAKIMITIQIGGKKTTLKTNVTIKK